MTQYIVSKGRYVKKSKENSSVSGIVHATKTIFINCNTFLSHRDQSLLRNCALDKPTHESAGARLDRSRRRRCQRASRAFFCLQAYWLFPLLRNAQQQLLQATQWQQSNPQPKNLLLLSLRRSLTSWYSQASTSNIVLGTAFAPVPYASRTAGVS